MAAAASSSAQSASLAAALASIWSARLSILAWRSSILAAASVFIWAHLLRASSAAARASCRASVALRSTSTLAWSMRWRSWSRDSDTAALAEVLASAARCWRSSSWVEKSMGSSLWGGEYGMALPAGTRCCRTVRRRCCPAIGRGSRNRGLVSSPAHSRPTTYPPASCAWAARATLAPKVVSSGSSVLSFCILCGLVLLGVHLGAVAEVEADRLHDPERRALGEHVGCREHAGVLLDDRGCGDGRDLVQIALHRCPAVRAVLHEVRRGVDRVDRLPRALGDVGHVLLMQPHVVAGAEPAEMTADEVLPRV